MKKMMLAMLNFLGIAAFLEKDGKMFVTDEQRDNIIAQFGQDFYDKFAKDLDNNFKEAAAGPGAEAQEAERLKAELSAANVKLAALESDKNALESEKVSLKADIAQKKSQIDIMAAAAIVEDPKNTNAKAGTDVENDKFLLGINKPHMAIDDAHPYNQRAYAAMMERRGINIPTTKQATMDYSSLESDLGSFYKIRKQDRIQSFLLELPSLESVFNLESGYQDMAVLVNVFMDEFSQADNTSSSFDNTVKGGYTFKPETLRMYDVMFNYKFKDLKKLEKTWIGYLNKEGSSTMKWSFIEFIMVETGKKLHNEREIRRVNGIRVEPTLNSPGRAIDASNGLYKYINMKLAEFKLRPFVLGEWNDSNISDYIRRGTAMIPAVVRDTGNIELYISPEALTAYHKNNETLYGLNQDYKSDIQYVKEYPNVKIKTIPNAGNRQRMIWTLAGNIALFEDAPGEMFKFDFEQEDWGLKVWSNWKEGIAAYMVGKPYTTADEIPTDYSTQLIFVNDVDLPASAYVEMVADDATPSVSNHTSLVSVANTAATAITNIDNAVVGVPVKLKCGNATNAITIAKSGNFSTLTAAWSPAVGDTLTVIKRADGKFIEIGRTTATSDIIDFAADDATPSVEGAAEFVTSENASACAITSFDDAIYDRLYTIHGAGSVHPSTIANAGSFVLTAAMTLGAGTWIKLVKSRTDDKFYEISRSA